MALVSQDLRGSADYIAEVASSALLDCAFASSLALRGDRSLEHVRIGSNGRSPEGNGKRDNLLEVPGHPLEAHRAAHDRNGPEPMGCVNPVFPIFRESMSPLAAVSVQSPIGIPVATFCCYVPGHREPPEMSCLPLTLHTGVGVPASNPISLTIPLDLPLNGSRFPTVVASPLRVSAVRTAARTPNLHNRCFMLTTFLLPVS